MATTAEGQHDGITTTGPDNKFDGVGPHPEVDGCTDMNIAADIRIRQGWMTGGGAPAASGFALGNIPD